MNKKSLVLASGILVFAGLAGLAVLRTDKNIGSGPAFAEAIAATLYKTPTCGCCGVYASYLKNKDYAVKTENVQDLSAIKEELGVPYELESCHTTMIGGYVIEGHVPEEAIRKLLTEKPDIRGIGMAGMPPGSPGMPGPKTDSFVIYEITHEGKRGAVFMSI